MLRTVSWNGYGSFTVLDPACGSGNFLYLALHALKDIEHQVQLEAEKERVCAHLSPK